MGVGDNIMNRIVKRCSATTALALTLGFAGFASSAAAQETAAMREVHVMARNATTTEEHAAVAKQYRLQAEALATKAEEHEAEVKRLMRSSGPMAHKWPAMAPKGIQRAKDLALEARRASRESLRLADHHVRLSVEALASR
jgi:hypothetical protein